MSVARHSREEKRTRLWGVVVLCLVVGLGLIYGSRLREDTGEILTAARSGGEVRSPSEPGDLQGIATPPVSSEAVTDNRPKIALIIDDVGFSLFYAKELSELKIPLTWSIIPYQSQSLSAMKLARAKGIPVMLHLPMEAEGDRPGLSYQVNLEMDEESIRGFVRRAARSLPDVVGVNNHRGSRATSTPRVMEAVLSEVRNLGLFFVDSRTSPKSVAFGLAGEMGIPTLKNEVFIDHEANQDSMGKALGRALSIARRKGFVVAIAHARPETLRFLETLNETGRDGVKWMTVPELILESRGSRQGGMSQ